MVKLRFVPWPLILLLLTPALSLAAGPAPAATGPKEAPADTPAVFLPDLAVISLTLSTPQIDRARTVLVVRIQNIGNAASGRTGLIVDCYQLGEEKQPCLGTNPPPLFRVPALPVGAARDYRVPLSRFLPRIGKKNQRYEIRARVDTGIRIQESNRYNNSRKLELTY